MTDVTGSELLAHFRRGAELGLGDVEIGLDTGGPVETREYSDLHTASPPDRHMTADEFLGWAIAQPDSARYEFVAGEVVTRPPQTAGHARARIAALDSLRAALALSNLPGEVFTRGMAVRVDDTTVYTPDAFLRCGEPLDDDCIEITDAIVVIEVLSPSSDRRDTGGKLEDCFRLPSVRHCLIVETSDRTLIHHALDGAGALQTRIVRTGTLELQPPGLLLDVESFFPPEV